MGPGEGQTGPERSGRDGSRGYSVLLTGAVPSRFIAAARARQSVREQNVLFFQCDLQWTLRIQRQLFQSRCITVRATWCGLLIYYAAGPVLAAICQNEAPRFARPRKET